MPNTAIRCPTLCGIEALSGQIWVEVEPDPDLPSIELVCRGGGEGIAVDRIRRSLQGLQGLDLSRARVWVEVRGYCATEEAEAAIALAIVRAYGLLRCDPDPYLLIGYVVKGRLMPCISTLAYAKHAATLGLILILSTEDQAPIELLPDLKVIRCNTYSEALLALQRGRPSEPAWCRTIETQLQRVLASNQPLMLIGPAQSTGARSRSAMASLPAPLDTLAVAAVHGCAGRAVPRGAPAAVLDSDLTVLDLRGARTVPGVLALADQGVVLVPNVLDYGEDVLDFLVSVWRAGEVRFPFEPTSAVLEGGPRDVVYPARFKLMLTCEPGNISRALRLAHQINAVVIYDLI